ncbi:MAG: acyl carrier protein [Flavobacteriales bacterium]|nr:MAG: acyl carrier protein [Flavobacteriales bacterium]
MDINNFIKELEEEFEEVEANSLKPETSFRDLPEWSSMHALIVIALVDIQYDVLLTGNDLRSCETISDLFTLIKKKR